jgi:hypothetical protein
MAAFFDSTALWELPWRIPGFGDVGLSQKKGAAPIAKRGNVIQ